MASGHYRMPTTSSCKPTWHRSSESLSSKFFAAIKTHTSHSSGFIMTGAAWFGGSDWSEGSRHRVGEVSNLARPTGGNKDLDSCILYTV